MHVKAFFLGYGVKQDYNQAMQWYQKAAAPNNFGQEYKSPQANAQNHLGMMYIKGLGIPKNYILGKDYLTTSCNNGSKLGCDNYKKYIDEHLK